MRKFSLVCGFIACAVVTTEASALVVRGSRYDPNYHGFAPSYSPSISNGEGANQAIANQARFDAVGAITIGSGASASQSCTGQLINAYTVLTAAHCVYNSKYNMDFRSDTSSLRFTTAPTVNDTSKTSYRVNGVYIASGWNGSLSNSPAGSDYALLRIYDQATGNGATEAPIGLTSITNPTVLNGFQFPITVGYGSNGFTTAAIDARVPAGTFPVSSGTQVPAGLIPAGWLNPDRQIANANPGTWVVPSAAKMAALNDRFEDLNHTAASDPYLVLRADSPGVLFQRGMPSTFNEGISAPGDSGGPLIVQTANGWEVAGIVSYGDFSGLDISNNQYDANGNLLNGYRSDFGTNSNTSKGKLSYYTRLTPAIIADINANLFKGPGTPLPPVPMPPNPGPSIYLQMNTASPVSLSGLAAAQCSPYEVSFDYGFGQASGIFDIELGGVVVDTLSPSGGLSGHYSRLFQPSNGCLPNAGGQLLESVAFDPITMLFTGPSGLKFFLDNLRLGDAFWDFSDGLDALLPSDLSHFAFQTGSIADAIGGGGSEGGNPVPEPATLSLICLGALAITLGRRRKR